MTNVAIGPEFSVSDYVCSTTVYSFHSLVYSTYVQTLVYSAESLK
jgi:hypothetical protein